MCHQGRKEGIPQSIITKEFCLIFLHSCFCLHYPNAENNDREKKGKTATYTLIPSLLINKPKTESIGRMGMYQ
jgi:G:T-mismatch repair DNA endonuclease (very short patch repair protein)